MERVRVSRISMHEPQVAVLALYLRDAAGLEVLPEIPRLLPEVSRHRADGAFDTVRANAEWAAWWEEILRFEAGHTPGERPPALGATTPVPEKYPVLSGLMAPIQREALDYSTARKREMAANAAARSSKVMHEILRLTRPSLFSLSRRRREVSLVVTVLPVTGSFAQMKSEAHLVVSLATYLDPESLDQAVRGTLGWTSPASSARTWR